MAAKVPSPLLRKTPTLFGAFVGDGDVGGVIAVEIGEHHAVRVEPGAVILLCLECAVAIAQKHA